MNVLLLTRELPLPTHLQGELQRRGHHLDRASRLEEGLERVRTRRADAVLLDLALGEQLIEQVREVAPRIPIIALGEDDHASAAARASAQGAFGYVPAPRGRGLDEEAALTVGALVERAAARARVETARNEALEESLRTRKFYEDVLTGVGQGIVVVDPDGKIKFVNPEAARILGEEDAVAGTLTGQAAVPLLQLLVETLAERRPRSSMIALEWEEEKISLDVTTSLLRSTEGEVAGAIAIVSDRSTEKRLEEQLIHSERLATLGSLLASIAHEIQNTLGSITGCAEMGLEVAQAAEQSAQGDPAAAGLALEKLSIELREIFDMVLQAGTSAQTIANNMLQYSRQGPRGNAVRQDLNLLVRQTLRTLGKHLGLDKVDHELELDPKNPFVKVEPQKVQQALVNLVVNAIQALQEVPSDRRTLRLVTETDPGAREALLHVKDRGPGISPRKLERIWHSFFTTKKHGTGLGLYITRTVVEDQGGRISVQSTPGEGTTFTIRLPLAD